MTSRPVKPRARRMALIDASVPELTMRTISIDGTASTINSASCVSRSVGAPKLAPLQQRLLHGLHDARMGMAEDERPPGADVIEVAIAVDVEEVGPFAAGDEHRLPPTPPKARAGLLTPPGMRRQARAKAS